MAKIFIVEDDVALRAIYKQLLTCLGHQIISEAFDGEDAIKKYTNLEEKPDIILMDHRMPNKNGIEATKEILKIDNSALIIFASADDKVRYEALQIGAISFLEKPFNIMRLAKIITNSLIKK